MWTWIAKWIHLCFKFRSALKVSCCTMTGMFPDNKLVSHCTLQMRHKTHRETVNIVSGWNSSFFELAHDVVVET